VAAVEWDREEVEIQRIGISMDREMGPAQEKNLKMEMDTGPKKAVGQAIATAVARKGRAGEIQQIRKNCIL